MLDAPFNSAQYLAGLSAAAFPFTGVSLATANFTLSSDLPRACIPGRLGENRASVSSNDACGVCLGELRELIECELWALRREWACGVAGGAEPLDSVAEDLSMAALTDVSIIASRGRRVSGICRSSCARVS